MKLLNSLLNGFRLVACAFCACTLPLYAQNVVKPLPTSSITELPRTSSNDSSNNRVSELEFSEPDTSKTSGSLPRLVEHSEQAISVYKGDKVSLRVSAQGPSLLYRWVRDDDTICASASCVINTSALSLGRHVITSVIYNSLGSQMVQFTIKVLANAGERGVETITPALIAAQNVETLSVEDFYVYASRGIGYTYEPQNVRVVAKLQRALKWSEGIRAHNLGVVVFGLESVEEHYLLPSAKAKLRAHPVTGKRIIELEEGTLRSRQFKDAAPAWLIVSDNSLQVDSSAGADILVSKSKDSIRLSVLRGSARLTKVLDEKKDEFYAEVVSAGYEIEYSKKSGFSGLRILADADLERDIKRTTPQYFTKNVEKKLKATAFIDKNFVKREFKNLLEVKIAAQSHLDSRNPISALETLLPHVKDGKSDSIFLHQMGQAYKSMGCFKEAFRFLISSTKTSKDNWVPRFEIAEMYFVSKNFAKAESAFKNVPFQSLPDPVAELAKYELAVAKFHSGRTYSARNDFRVLVRTSKNQDIVLSSLEFVGAIGDKRWYGAMARGSLGSDSNVFRWGSGTRTSGYETVSSLFYRGSLDIFARGFENPDGALRFGYFGENISYLTGDAAEVNPVVQQLYLYWRLDLGRSDSEPAYLRMEFKPHLQLVSIREERSSDQNIVEAAVTLPRVDASPTLSYSVVSATDPMPGYEDRLDPILLEPVSLSDRSVSMSSFGLSLNFGQYMQSSDFRLGFKQKTATYKASAVQVDDFKQLDFFGEYKHYYSDYIAGLNLDLGTRKFAKSEDSRGDKITSYELLLGYKFSETFQSHVDYSSFTQKSNRSISSYNKTIYSLGLDLEI